MALIHSDDIRPSDDSVYASTMDGRSGFAAPSPSHHLTKVLVDGSHHPS